MCSPAEYVSMTRERTNGESANGEQSRLAFRIAGHLVNTFGEREDRKSVV